MKAKIMKIKRGSVLVLAVVMVVILLIVGLAMITLASNSRLQAVRSELGIAARTAADAGLAKASALMMLEYAKYANTGVNYNNNPLTLLTNVTGTLATGTLSGTTPPASYSYTVSYDAVGKYYTIASTGTVSRTQRTVYATLVGQNHFFGMGLRLNLNAQNNDDFRAIASNSGLPFTVKTNSTANDAIDLSKSKIYGDVAVGYGGNPYDVIDGYTVGHEHDKVTGAAYASPNYEYPVAVAPSGLPAGPSNYAITQSCQYAQIGTDTTAVAVTIPANLGKVTISVLGSMNISNLIINKGSSLSLYIGQDLTGKNNVAITNLNQDSSNNNNPDPAAVMIYGTGDVTSIQNITMKNNADMYAGIYAPNADIELKNNGNITGAVIAKSFTVKNNLTFYYDSDFNNFNLLGVPNFYLAQTRWWE